MPYRKGPVIKFRTVRLDKNISRGGQLYRGLIVNTHVKGIEETADDLAVRLSNTMDPLTIRHVLDAFAYYLPQLIAEDGCPRRIGNLLTLSLRIGGTFPTADAPFDPSRNELYLSASLPRKLQKVPAGRLNIRNTFEKADQVQDRPYLSMIYDRVNPKGGPYEEHVCADDQIVINGNLHLVVPGRADEGVWAQNAKTGQKTALIVDERLKASDMVCHFPSRPKPGRYTMIVQTRGGAAVSTPYYILTRSFRVYAK